MLLLVVGTGRTGSCWLGHILQSHPAITCTVEDSVTFPLARRMALYPSRSPECMGRLVAIYRDRVRKHAEQGQHYADKAHPLLWRWRDLWRAFPGGVWFLSARRNCEDVVRSMLHNGAIRSQTDSGWRKLELPNRFAGIRRQEDYERRSLAGRCALRWAAHEAEADRLEAECPNVIRVQYEQLRADPAGVLASIRQRLRLRAEFPPVDPQPPREYPPLTDQQRAEIDSAVSSFAPWW
jgi:hypothetical protein